MKKFCLVVFFIFLAVSTTIIADSIMVPISDFRPVYNTATEKVHFYLGEQYGYLTSTSTSPWIMTPVELPDGAKLVKITLFFYDNGAEHIRCYVIRANVYNGTRTTNFSLITTGAEDAYRNQSDSGYMKMNMGGYTHVIYLNMPYGLAYRVRGVKLIYNM